MASAPRVMLQRPGVPGVPANTPPSDEFHICVQRYANDLLDEVERLEVAQRTGSGTSPEFTSSMVTDADRLLRRAYRSPRRKPGKEIAWRVFVALALIGVGVASNNLKETWGIWLFVVSMTVALAGTIFDLVREEK